MAEKKETKRKPPVGKRIQSGEEAKRMGSKGGKASGKSRRFARDFREAADTILSEVAGNGDKAANAMETIVRTLVKQATKGSTKAAELLMKLRGDLVERQQVDMNVPKIDIEVIGGSDE